MSNLHKFDFFRCAMAMHSWRNGCYFCKVKEDKTEALSLIVVFWFAGFYCVFTLNDMLILPPEDNACVCVCDFEIFLCWLLISFKSSHLCILNFKYVLSSKLIYSFYVHVYIQQMYYCKNVNLHAILKHDSKNFSKCIVHDII